MGSTFGPTRARQEWSLLGVNGLGVADEPPGSEVPTDHVPKLTVRMAARTGQTEEPTRAGGAQRALTDSQMTESLTTSCGVSRPVPTY